MFGRPPRAGFRASSLRGRPSRVGERAQPVLFTFLNGLSSGQKAQFSAPSLLVNDATGSLPFGPSPSASIGPFDWCNYLPWDPITKRILAAGGRTASVAAATKVMLFDAVANAARSFVNPWGVGTGHIYNGLCVIEQHRRFFFRSFHTGGLLLWDIDNEVAVSPLPAVPGTYRIGENPAFQWFPNWGSQGSLVVVGRNVDADEAIVGRYDWALGAWQSPVFVAGTSVFPDDHPAGCYVPAASAGIFGDSRIGNLRKALIVPSGGATPYFTANVCPGGFSVLTPTQGLLTPHPSRAAAVVISKPDLRAYTYEFASDTWVDRGSVPSIYGSINQAITTIPEADGLVSLHDITGSAIAEEMWCWRVGTSLG